MLLARGTARRKEIALRLALGSSRLRVVRQLLTESLVVAVAGGGAGLLLAAAGTRLLVATLANVLPIGVAFDATPDVRVMGATFGFCLLSTVLAGLMPAWRVTRPDVLPDLKEQPADRGGARRLSLRNLLVVGQVALSLALVTAAGLFMRGAVKAGAADPGFPLEGGVIAALEPSLARYDETRGRAAMRAILQRTRALPGVQSASLASLVPFGELTEAELVQKAGTPPAPEGQRDTGVSATFTIVGADYFETVRVAVMRGRGFTAAEEEAAGGGRVAIIDDPLARQLFGGDDPLGQRIQFRSRRGGEVTAQLEIIGIVAGTRHDIFDRGAVPHVFVPYGQHYRGAMNLHVRAAASGDHAEAALVQMLREALRAAEPGVPVLSIKTLRQHRDSSIALWAVNTGAGLFSVFGGVALLLAIVGVYGVKAYVVSRRTREIGIRMALGASARDVMWLVLREGLTLTAIGVALGMGLAALVGQALSRMLYEVGALDPLVFVVSPVLLAAAAMFACYVPARRATRVVPLAALRAE
jgi:predicted permease